METKVTKSMGTSTEDETGHRQDSLSPAAGVQGAPPSMPAVATQTEPVCIEMVVLSQLQIMPTKPKPQPSQIADNDSQETNELSADTIDCFMCGRSIQGSLYGAHLSECPKRSNWEINEAEEVIESLMVTEPEECARWEETAFVVAQREVRGSQPTVEEEALGKRKIVKVAGQEMMEKDERAEDSGDEETKIDDSVTPKQNDQAEDTMEEKKPLEESREKMEEESLTDPPILAEIQGNQPIQVQVQDSRDRREEEPLEVDAVEVRIQPEENMENPGNLQLMEHIAGRLAQRNAEELERVEVLANILEARTLMENRYLSTGVNLPPANPQPPQGEDRAGLYREVTLSTYCRLPEVVFQAIPNDESSCPICIEGLETGHIHVLTPCNHLFHDFCLSRALRFDRRCPMCREFIPLLRIEPDLEQQPIPPNEDILEEMQEEIEELRERIRPRIRFLMPPAPPGNPNFPPIASNLPRNRLGGPLDDLEDIRVQIGPNPPNPQNPPAQIDPMAVDRSTSFGD